MLAGADPLPARPFCGANVPRPNFFSFDSSSARANDGICNRSVLWTLAAPPQDFWSESGHTRGYNDDVRSDAALAFLLFNTRKDTIQADNNGLPVVGCSIANVVSVFEDWR